MKISDHIKRSKKMREELNKLVSENSNLTYSEYLKVAKNPYKNSTVYYRYKALILGKDRRNKELYDDLKEIMKINIEINYQEYLKESKLKQKYSYSRFNMNKQKILDSWGLKQDWAYPKLKEKCFFITNEHLFNRANKEINDTIELINRLYSLIPAKEKRFRMSNVDYIVFKEYSNVEVKNENKTN